MDGYYDYHPLISLDRHFAVAGYLGEETRTVGYQLAALTGLPVADLDRKIEHRAGKSVWELIWTEGEARYRQLEREELAKVLADRPYGVVTLGDGTLIDDDSRRRILGETDLVVLDLDLANCYWRLKAGPRAEREYWHPLHPGPLQTFEQVRPFHQQRAPGFADAHHRIELRGKQRSDVVEVLMAMLPELADQPK